MPLLTARVKGWVKPCLCLFALLISANSLAEHKDLKLADTRLVSPEETLLINALHQWQSGNPKLATTTLDSLQQLAPHFGIAESLRAALQSQPQLGNRSLYDSFVERPLSPAVEKEFQQRWEYFLNPVTDNLVPSHLLRLADSQRYAIAVDMTHNRIYLFENLHNQPKLVADFYAGIRRKGFGKQLEGDLKTPIGVYFVNSHLVDEELDELYGIGAFPLNYPNALDKQRQRTGSGIWIHGVPRNTWTRAPKSSRGCVTVANRNFERLLKHVEPRNTPVLLADGLNWVNAEEPKAQQEALMAAIHQWAKDWESLDTEKYLTHYSQDFFGQGMTLAQWQEHKQRINKHKEWITLGIGDISLFNDPRENIVVASFVQDYKSNNFASRDRKRQYWQQQDDGSWKILLENGI